MNALIVEDSKVRLNALLRSLQDVNPLMYVATYGSAEEAIEAGNIKTYDVAFLDVGLPKMDGLALARYLQGIKPQLNIVFVTESTEYMADALALYCSSYLLKPVDAQQVRGALEHLRYPVEGALPSEKRLRVQCFGNFEVFYGDKPVSFRRGRTKELLAYLVSLRGATASVGEVEAVLWEQASFASSNQSYLRHLVADLSKRLEELGEQDVLIRERGRLGVVPQAFSCDYYDYLDGLPGSRPAVRRFMAQYSWAEREQAALFGSA